jgi:hypothetical protein
MQGDAPSCPACGHKLELTIADWRGSGNGRTLLKVLGGLVALVLLMSAVGLIIGEDDTSVTSDEATDPTRTSASETSVPPYPCRVAPADLVSAIASGLTVAGGGGLRDAFYVTPQAHEQNSAGWPLAIVAAEITGGGMGGVVGTWATGDPATVSGPVIALNGYAKEFSDWGAAAAQGSQADEVRSSLAQTDAAASAENCTGS